MDMLSLLCSNDNCLTGLTWIISDMINGYLPNSTKQYFLSSQLIGIVKPNGQLRPISMSETLFKLACCYALNTIELNTLPFGEIQFGVDSKAGVEQMIHSVR